MAKAAQSFRFGQLHNGDTTPRTSSDHLRRPPVISRPQNELASVVRPAGTFHSWSLQPPAALEASTAEARWVRSRLMLDSTPIRRWEYYWKTISRAASSCRGGLSGGPGPGACTSRISQASPICTPGTPTHCGCRLWDVPGVSNFVNSPFQGCGSRRPRKGWVDRGRPVPHKTHLEHIL